MFCATAVRYISYTYRRTAIERASLPLSPLSRRFVRLHKLPERARVRGVPGALRRSIESHASPIHAPNQPKLSGIDEVGAAAA